MYIKNSGQRHPFRAVILLVMLLLIFTSCSSSIDDASASKEISESDSGSAVQYTNSSSARKLIRNITLEIQTKNFNQVMSDITSTLSQLGGYTEQSEITGTGYDDESTRNAFLTLRVPSDKTAQLLAIFNSDNSSTVSQSENTTDVSLEYIDVESRLSSLRTQKEALEKLLSESQSISDTITLQAEITNVIYQIESYESQLRTFDDLISYDTVKITLIEVEIYTENNSSFGEVLSTGIRRSFSDLGDFFKQLSLWFLINIPYILLFAVIVAVVIIACRISKKRKKK